MALTQTWRPIPGTGQTVSLTSGTAGNFTNAMSNYAFAIRLAPNATPYIAFVKITHAGTAAAAEADYPIASSDPPQILVCAPGDVVSVYQASGSTEPAYLCELTQ